MRRGERGGIPTSAECLDQLHAVHDLRDPQGHGRLLIAKERRLGRNDVEVRIDAKAVAIGGQVKASLCGRDRDVLLLNFLGENPEAGKIILHLLKRGEDSVAVVGDRLIVLGAILFDGGTAQASIVNQLRYGWSDGPGPARPG